MKDDKKKKDKGVKKPKPSTKESVPPAPGNPKPGNP